MKEVAMTLDAGLNQRTLILVTEFETWTLARPIKI